ncbi:MAG: macro domain-containing protein [Terriglobia bacterium]
MPTKIHILKGDITEMAVDALVNAANTDLMLGSGVAGAIRRKGGSRIQEECDRLAPVAMGDAVVTTGGNLRALYVVHAASMRLGGGATPESLGVSVRNSLERAEEKGFQSIAFPAIGTGAGGLPVDDCARIMIEAVFDYLRSRTCLQRIYFVLFDDAALKAFEDAYHRRLTQLQGDESVSSDARLNRRS